MEYKLTFEDDSTAYLSHHGIKGMKWGVWNTETAARYAGKTSIGGAGGLAEDEDVSYGGLSDEEDPENVKFAKEHPDVFEFADHELSPDEAQEGTNPMWGAGVGRMRISLAFKQMFGMDYKSNYLLDSAFNNCATCSMIYDLRRRGYDVDAAMTRNAMHINQVGELETFYKGAKPKEVSDNTLKTLDKELSAMPDGARGNMWGTTVNGTGHAIAWEKENGKVVYRDCQTGKKYDDKQINQLFKEKNATGPKLTYCRLDNCKPNLSTMYSNGLVSKKGAEDTREKVAKTVGREASGQLDTQLRYYRNSGYTAKDLGYSHMGLFTTAARTKLDAYLNPEAYVDELMKMR